MPQGDSEAYEIKLAKLGNRQLTEEITKLNSYVCGVDFLTNRSLYRISYIGYCEDGFGALLSLAITDPKVLRISSAINELIALGILEEPTLGDRLAEICSEFSQRQNPLRYDW